MDIEVRCHFFTEGDLYRTGPADRPLAQRDDRGKKDTINGDPVGYAHARHTDSALVQDGVDNDNDGEVDEDREQVDDPGIESLCFDLSGDTFRFVRTFEMNDLGSGVSNPGFLANEGPTEGRADTIESYLSYRDGRSL